MTQQTLAWTALGRLDTHKRTHTQTCAHTDTCTRTRTRTRTRKHKHSHTRKSVRSKAAKFVYLRHAVLHSTERTSAHTNGLHVSASPQNTTCTTQSDTHTYTQTSHTRLTHIHACLQTYVTHTPHTHTHKSTHVTHTVHNHASLTFFTGAGLGGGALATGVGGGGAGFAAGLAGEVLVVEDDCVREQCN